MAAAALPPLLAAASAGDEAAVDRLLSSGTARMDLNLCDEQRETALHKAAAGGHAGVISRLVAAGADVLSRNDRALTPLAHALAGNHEAAVRALLAAGAVRGVFLSGLQNDSLLMTLAGPEGLPSTVRPELLALIDSELRAFLSGLPAEPPADAPAVVTQPFGFGDARASSGAAAGAGGHRGDWRGDSRVYCCSIPSMVVSRRKWK